MCFKGANMCAKYWEIHIQNKMNTFVLFFYQLRGISESCQNPVLIDFLVACFITPFSRTGPSIRHDLLRKKITSKITKFSWLNHSIECTEYKIRVIFNLHPPKRGYFDPKVFSYNVTWILERIHKFISANLSVILSGAIDEATVNGLAQPANWVMGWTSLPGQIRSCILCWYSVDRGLIYSAKMKNHFKIIQIKTVVVKNDPVSRDRKNEQTYMIIIKLWENYAEEKNPLTDFYMIMSETLLWRKNVTWGLGFWIKVKLNSVLFGF